MGIAIDIVTLVIIYSLVSWLFHLWTARKGSFQAFRYLELLWATAIVVPIGYFIFYVLDSHFRESFWLSLVFAFLCMVTSDLLAEKYPRKHN